MLNLAILQNSPFYPILSLFRICGCLRVFAGVLRVFAGVLRVILGAPKSANERFSGILPQNGFRLGKALHKLPRSGQPVPPP